MKRKSFCGLAMMILAAGMCFFFPFMAGNQPAPIRLISAGITGETPEAIHPAGYGTIDINTAGQEALISLHGIGETLAGEIIRKREIYGWFYYPEDLISVKGIGEKKLNGFVEAICFESGE